MSRYAREMQGRIERASAAHNRALWGMTQRGPGDRAREAAILDALRYLEALSQVSRGVQRGDRVRVVAGRKVPLGFVGTVFWVGESRYGVRVGLKVNARDMAEEPKWTAIENVALADGPAPVTDLEIAAIIAPAMPHVEAIEAGRIVVDSSRAAPVPAINPAAADNVRAALGGVPVPAPVAAPAPAPAIPTDAESRRFALLEFDDLPSLTAEERAKRDDHPDESRRFALLEVD